MMQGFVLGKNHLFDLAMENLFDTCLDVGAPSFQLQMVQCSFAMAYKILLAQLICPELLVMAITTTDETCPQISCRR